jgi:hypothetical protein
MPRRASQTKWNGSSEFGNAVLIRFPNITAVAAGILAGWTVTEARLGQMFGTLIGAKQPVTMSMYSAVRSFEVQRDLIKAACTELMPQRYAMLAAACLDVVYKVSGTRHRLAHWVWGMSTDPDLTALLLVEPRSLWRLHVSLTRHWSNPRVRKRLGADFLLKSPKLDPEDIWLYTFNDLQGEVAEVDRAYRIVDALIQLVGSDAVRRRAIYRWLCSEADLQSALKKVKKNWPRNRSILRAPRGKAPQK